MSTILMSVPYTYRVVGQVKGGKSVKLHFVSDVLEVEVPQVSGADAPVGLTVAKGGEPADITLRAYNRKPYHIFRGGHRKGSLFNFNTHTPEVFQHWCDKVIENSIIVQWMDYPVPYHKVEGALMGGGRVLHGTPFKVVEEDFQEQDRAIALAAAQDLLVVDGRMYVRQPEPRWEACRSGESIHLRVYAGTQKVAQQAFRIDRRESALAFAEGVAGDIPIIDEYRVADAGLIDWKWEDRAVSLHVDMDSVFDLLGGQMSSQLRWMDRSFFDPMADLSQMMENREALTPDRIDTEACLSLLHRLHAAARVSAHPKCSLMVTALLQRTGDAFFRQEEVERYVANRAEDMQAMRGIL